MPPLLTEQSVDEGQNDVPALLRRVAYSIEDLDQIEPRHLIMDLEIREEGLFPVITLYHHGCRLGTLSGTQTTMTTRVMD